MRKRYVILVFLLTLFLLGTALFLFFDRREAITIDNSINDAFIKTGTMKIESSAFPDNGLIPEKFTCDGENINPQLIFSDIPIGTKSLVFIMDDPDVPKNLRPDGLWVHWVMYNIPPNIKEISENSALTNVAFGIGTSQKTTYGGPCPPDREHRYFFKLYALNVPKLSFVAMPTKEQIELAMEGHIIEAAQLMGRYDRKR